MSWQSCPQEEKTRNVMLATETSLISEGVSLKISVHIYEGHSIFLSLRCQGDAYNTDLRRRNYIF